MNVKSLFARLDKTVLLLVAMVLVMALIALMTGGWQLVFDGVAQAGRLFESVWIRLLLGFTLGGLVRVLIPSAIVARWLGHSSGLKGVIIGAYLGILVPGGPFVFLPVVASIYSAGAGPGPIIALMAGRAMLGLNNFIVWEIPFLGFELPLTKYIVGLLFPPLLGLAGMAVFRLSSRLFPSKNVTSAGESASTEEFSENTDT